MFLICGSVLPISPLQHRDRPIGCLSKPRCWIQAVTPASGALARPQPLAPPRPLRREDVIFLFLSPALPPPSPSLSSFSFLIPLSSPPPLLFSHRYVPLALKGVGLPLRAANTPPRISASLGWRVLAPSCLSSRPKKKKTPTTFKKKKKMHHGVVYLLFSFLFSIPWPPPPWPGLLE